MRDMPERQALASCGRVPPSRAAPTPLRSTSLHLAPQVHGRVTDIWRAYFAQRLLWDVGLRIAFALPWVTQVVIPLTTPAATPRARARARHTILRTLHPLLARCRPSLHVPSIDIHRHHRPCASLPAQYRNVHVLLGDFNSEVPLYQQSSTHHGAERPYPCP